MSKLKNKFHYSGTQTTKHFFQHFFFLKIINITLDQHPNWAKILDPDTNSMKWHRKVRWVLNFHTDHSLL